MIHQLNTISISNPGIDVLKQRVIKCHGVRILPAIWLSSLIYASKYYARARTLSVIVSESLVILQLKEYVAPDVNVSKICNRPNFAAIKYFRYY